MHVLASSSDQSHCLFQSKPDEDLNKYVLECLHLGHTLWKHKIPQDTEDEREGWAVQQGWARGHTLWCHTRHAMQSGLPHHWFHHQLRLQQLQGRHLHQLQFGISSSSRRAWSGWGGGEEGCSGDNEVSDGSSDPGKRSYLPLSQKPGTFQRCPMPCLLLGGMTTKCPVCYLSFKMGYHLRKCMDVHLGWAVSLWEL